MGGVIPLLLYGVDRGNFFVVYLTTLSVAEAL
jgi:hypothetical protein